jgi:copper chaperone
MAMGRHVRTAVAVLAGVVAATALGCAGDPVVRTELTVEGMHCDGCEEAITDELSAIEGVVTVEADWEAERVVARHHERAAPTAILVETVESLGYTVHGAKTEPVDA